MCGIAGVYNFNDKQVDSDLLVRMGRAMHHRGPDNQNLKVFDNVGLVHARLSILDLSKSANQPMTSACGRYCVVYNGEIYNYIELREELTRLGSQFKTSGDTEVLVEGYSKLGEAIFDKLNGMFSCAVFDLQSRSITIARDRFGIKPLFYYQDKNRLLFGSEIKTILEEYTIEKVLDWHSFSEYLHFGTCLGKNSFFKGIMQLEPGDIAKITSKGVITFNKISTDSKTNSSENVDSFEDAVEKVRSLIEQGVCRQLASDVPVGLFLSGGIDSSAIAAFASRHYKGQIKTFSAGFDFDKGVNELPKARNIAKKFKTEHHEIHIKGKSLVNIIEKLVVHHDKPFSDAANLALYMLTGELNTNVKVILQGDGGDEVFGGYHRYQRLSNIKKWKLISPLVAMASNLLPKNKLLKRSRRTLEAFKSEAEFELFARLISQEPFDRNPISLLTSRAQKALSGSNPFNRYKEVCNNLSCGTDVVGRMMEVDRSIILPDLYFAKVDRSTMAKSIEVRVPFLDNDLVDYVNGLPSHYKVTPSSKKHILKKALEGIVPKDILYGPKTGFGVPFSYWLKTSLLGYLKENILSKNFLELGIFDEQMIKQMIDNHVSGKEDNGFILLKILNFALWIKFYQVRIEYD